VKGTGLGLGLGFRLRSPGRACLRGSFFGRGFYRWESQDYERLSFRF